MMMHDLTSLLHNHVGHICSAVVILRSCRTQTIGLPEFQSVKRGTIMLASYLYNLTIWSYNFRWSAIYNYSTGPVFEYYLVQLHHPSRRFEDRTRKVFTRIKRYRCFWYSALKVGNYVTTTSPTFPYWLTRHQWPWRKPLIKQIA